MLLLDIVQNQMQKDVKVLLREAAQREHELTQQNTQMKKKVILSNFYHVMDLQDVFSLCHQESLGWSLKRNKLPGNEVSRF